MIDRIELAEELVLRESVRKAIRIVKTQKNKLNRDEVALRRILREFIAEGQSAVATGAKHANTGINSLEDLLKNTNVLSVLETGYKSLTTDVQQRESFKNHILNAIKTSLAPEESRKEAGADVEIAEGIDEDVELEIGDRPEDDPDFIDINDDGEVEEVEVDEKELQTNVEPPAETEDAVADADESEFEDEGMAPAFELQEVLKFLDIDDIIENLL